MTEKLIIAATLLSSFLLFAIQPMYAKYLLPYFGGTSSVWTISIFFYSSILLLGYVYAALLTEWPLRLARWIHSSFLLLAGSLLLGRWLLSGSSVLGGVFTDQAPAVAVFMTLVFAVGLPVLMLASTSVLTQYLYSRVTDKEPYVLYAVSNVGSLLGLASYPFLMEPLTALQFQVGLWTFGFVAFICILLVSWQQVESLSRQVSQIARVELSGKLDNKIKILLLAAIPTFLLASLTELISRGIASFPMLWVVPLMIYLGSFVLAFSNRKLSVLGLPLSFIATLSIAPVYAYLPIMNKHPLDFWMGFFFFMIAFALLSVYFHRRIYELRPRVADLGLFYIFLTLGGALGSGVVGLVLPLVLNRLIEFVVVISLIGMYMAHTHLDVIKQYTSQNAVLMIKVILLTSPVILVIWTLTSNDVLYQNRNFYGTVKVTEKGGHIDGTLYGVRVLVSGNTIHGMQLRDEEYQSKAIGYYVPESGIGVSIRSFIDEGVLPRLHVVGLGSGAMNAYCDDVTSVTYSEINPQMVDVAETYFTYLDMCPEKTLVKVGDGRLLLEEEVNQGSITYDIIMLDAFTDDAIPPHLLTTEAFSRAYEPLLSENGVVVFHVSNRYLDLSAPIAGMAHDNGYEALWLHTPEVEGNVFRPPSNWVLVTKEDNVEKLLQYPGVKRITDPDLVWSDAKSSVLQVLTFTPSNL